MSGGATAAERPAAAPGGERPSGATGTRPATREDVRNCYRYILGREPETEAVLDRHVESAPTLAELRRRFIHSDEFRVRDAPVPKPALDLAPPRMEVEVEAPPDQLAAMLARIGQYWEQIGAEAPHWSVLTQPRFRPDGIAESREEFYRTGATDRDLVQQLLRRHGIAPGSLGRCVEFGCGVGRATLKLAELFPQVVGCDISAPHLALAAAEATARGVRNLAWHRSSIAAPMPEGGWDFWYSRLVLQHNPPPVIAHLLRLAFAGLAPGGVAIFQVPTYQRGYRFRIAEDLARQEPPGMEMHPLPQATVFALAAAAGLAVLELREDTHWTVARTELWLSNLFVLRRPAAPSADDLAKPARPG
jgi:SAM-dependent methyltransferase